jgi:spoIIIJ-associated protein
MRVYMSDNKLQPTDVTGPSLEEAIDKGLEQLGLTRNDVIIEIVEEGSKGVLGIGAREAVVRLTPLHVPSAAPTAKPAAAHAARAAATPTARQSDDESLAPSASPEELEEEANIGKQMLDGLLEKLGVTASVSAHRSEGSDPTTWVLDIQGRDLGVLIGRRGETLEALQYLTRLMVNHKLERRSSLVLDVESYKSRRELSLRKLAERMASQATELGRTVTLEPMPPNERRIIHMALQEDTTVRTESVGEGEHRKVTIIPVKTQ